MDSDRRWQIWNCSRQSGKSTTAALKALHTARHLPGSLSLLISPTLRQSGELFGKVRLYYGRLPMSDSFKIVEDSTQHGRWSNGSRIVALPGSSETVRGYSDPALVVLDEAAHCPTELYHTLRPMLAVSGGTMILASTPYGKRGFFWETWQNDDTFDKVQITADMCPRISKEFLAQERNVLKDWFDQEYMGVFLDVQGGLFSPEMIAEMEVIDTEVDPIAKPWLPEDVDEADD